MDPETGLDAVRNVAVCDGKIVRISSDALIGKRVIHANGLVVAPGFIDLHQHGQDLESQRLKALDGVTTALEFEIGAPDVAQFLKAKQGHRAENPATGGWSAGNASRARAVARVPLEVAQQPRNLFDAERTLTSGPCKTCGNPHGNGRCPVADLNRIQELETAVLTPILELIPAL